MTADSYKEILRYRNEHIGLASIDHYKLNLLHDEIMKQVVRLAISISIDRDGPPPCPFSFFVMGSAGRFEQSVWSDQDHGIVYFEKSEQAKTYFLALGEEISNGLYRTGYNYCDGGVMSNNPLWCKSLYEWQRQLADWILESSWESVRQLLIFIDSRTLYGEELYIKQLKSFIYQSVQKDHLLKKLLNNTMYRKKGIGVLGQFLTDTHGPHAGTLNIKETALFPIVNSVRLLAIKGSITSSSTLTRLSQLPERWIPADKKQLYQSDLVTLFEFRLKHGDHINYDNGHYLPMDTLSKEEKSKMKEILKTGSALHRYVKEFIEKEESNGDE